MLQPRPASSRARRRKIQLPYLNTFESIWEYAEAFFARRIDFPSYLGPFCPICGECECYREITCYHRYAIELFPEFEKRRIPVARFVCKRTGATFSLLPIQLIPYFQYTVNAVIGTLLLGSSCWQKGQRGFYGAMIAVDPDSDVTPWLILCWLTAVLRGCRGAHRVLGRFYDLSEIRTEGTIAWREMAAYFSAFGWRAETRWGPPLHSVLYRYSRSTCQFLFGTTSQQRLCTPGPLKGR